jgi:hypothetical protein
VTSKAEEIAAVYVGVLVADSTYPEPMASIERLAKVAMPAVTVVAPPPPSAPPPGLVPMASKTCVALSVVSIFPYASSRATCTAGVMVVPATVVFGCATKTSLLDDPTVTLKLADDVCS